MGHAERLRTVLTRDLSFSERDAVRFAGLIASYAKDDPSLTLGGVGVIPLHDIEDRHVLETAWAGPADILVTANLADFIQDDSRTIVESRTYRLDRAGRCMILAHPFEAVRWLRDER